MTRRLPFTLRPLLPLLAGATLLAGCGGEATKEVDATGVLSDSPVQGVAYLRNGVASGSTDALGQFRYRAGETIEFRIGKLVLGSVTGSGDAMTVTPLELAEALAVAARPNRVTNLLILLQALDADGDPDNGIEIPAAAVAMLDEDAEVALLNLGAAPATFLADTDLDAIVTAINAVPGASAAKPATADAALAHFRQQFLQSLAGNYIGSVGANAVALRFLDNGDYLQGEVGNDDSAGTTGLERGSIDWDPATGEVTVALPDQDSNEGWGFSYIRELTDVQFRVDAGDLVVNERNAEGVVTASYRLPRHYDSASSLTGTWTKGASGSLQVLHLFMRDDSLVMALNPGADKTLLGRTNTGCSQAGVEFGSYSIGAGFLSFSGMGSQDTDGCGGLHDANLFPDYLLATGAYVSPVVTNVDYASAITWNWNTIAGFQSATLYRPDNTVAP